MNYDYNEGLNFSENPDVNVKKKKANSKTLITFLIILVILTIIGGTIFYFYNKYNEEINLYEVAINNISYKFQNMLNSIDKEKYNFDLNEPLTIDLDAKLNTNLDVLKDYNDLTYHVSLISNNHINRYSAGINIKNDKSVLLNLIYAIFYDKTYIKTNLYDKVINLSDELDIDSSIYNEISKDSLKFNIDYDNINYITSTFKDILINTIDKKKLVYGKDNLVINDKEYKVNKVSYIMDVNTINNTIKYIKSSILNNDKLIDAILNISNILDNNLVNNIVSKEDVKNILINNLKQETLIETCPTITINFYGNSKENIVAGDINSSDNSFNYSFTNVNDELIISGLYNDGTKILINLKDNSLFVRTYYEIKETSLFSFENDNDTIKINYKYDYKDKKVNVDISTTVSENTSEKFNREFEINVSTNLLQDDFDLGLKGNYSIKKEAEFISPINSVKLKNIPEEDLNELYSKLNELLNQFNLQDFLPEFNVKNSFKIVDETKNGDYTFNVVDENFFQDDEYIYYFPYPKSAYINVYYSDGSIENIKDALENGNVKISDLDTYNIFYRKKKIDE